MDGTQGAYYSDMSLPEADSQHSQKPHFSNSLQIDNFVSWDRCGRTFVFTVFVEFSQIGFLFFHPPDVKVTALAVETEKDAIKEISSSSISNFATFPSLFENQSFWDHKKIKKHCQRHNKPWLSIDFVA